MKTKRLRRSAALLLLAAGLVAGQAKAASGEEDAEVFVAYELGEMAFNAFRNFAGEVGVRRGNGHLARLVVMDVVLTENHLSSGFANVVEGGDVEGRFQGVEAFYDIPVYKRLYGGVGLGYYRDAYTHVENGESVEHATPTVGFEVAYRETGLFSLDGLYLNLAFPFRFYLDPLEKRKLGESTVNRHFFENNIWLFVGYAF